MSRRAATVLYTGIAAVKRANAAAGQHFFSPATVRYFSSRVESKLIDGRYFVTSEQYEPSEGPPDPRRYTVREALPSGHVTTVGEFQQHATLDAALAAARALTTPGGST